MERLLLNPIFDEGGGRDDFPYLDSNWSGPPENEPENTKM